jgi:5-methylcytosine-specific restriction endonuclease McrA
MKVRKTKVCPRCGRRKPFSAYWKNRVMPDGVQVHCKPCMRLSINESIRRHPETALISQRNRRDNGKMRLRVYLLAHRCVVCGERDPDTLDFHHLKKKRYEVSRMKGHAWKTVLKEIAKCEILCSNCHRRRTRRDNMWW